MSVPCLNIAVFMQRIIFILMSPTVIMSAVPIEFESSEVPKNHTKSYDNIIGLRVMREQAIRSFCSHQKKNNLEFEKNLMIVCLCVCGHVS